MTVGRGSVLVTGGAGYVGSHVVNVLARAGIRTLVVDDFSTGRPELVRNVHVVTADIADAGSIDLLARVMSDSDTFAVVHCAGKKSVEESVRFPDLYERVNVLGTSNLVEAMKRAAVARLVFSSSAAVYAPTASLPVSEADSLGPVSPYGTSKLRAEDVILSDGNGWLSSVILRYFNVAGCDNPSQVETDAPNLIPATLRRLALGERPVVYGADFDTRDGTCVRDFVDARDLADAHLDCLRWLDRQKTGTYIMNIGSGSGFSVLEIVRAAIEITGIDLEPLVSAARPGDIPEVVADLTRVKQQIGWEPKRSVEEMISSHWSALLHLAKEG